MTTDPSIPDRWKGTCLNCDDLEILAVVYEDGDTPFCTLLNREVEDANIGVPHDCPRSDKDTLKVIV